MAQSRISRISSASAEATTVTLGTHAARDLILICAVRDGSTTNPTIPAGWTNITNTTDGTSISVSVGWKWAASAAETSGTWTNATGLMCHVYRGADPVTPFGTFGGGSSVDVTVNYSSSTGVTRARMDNQWIIRFAICRGVDTTTLNTTPTDCTNVINALGATQDMVSFDTNGAVQNGAAAQTISHGGASQGNINIMIPMYPPQMKLNNYQSARCVSAGVISVGERIR